MKTKIFTLLLPIILISSTLQAQTVARLDSIIKAYVDIAEFNGSVLIAKKGKILLEKGYGLSDQKAGTPNTPATVYQIASITKTFTSALVLKLAEQKKLSVNDKMSKYFPTFKAGDSITIAHLLSHTSGISNRSTEEKFRDFDFKGRSALEKLIFELDGTPSASAPGTKFSYNVRGYYLLGHLIEKLTGMSYEQAISTYIFKPYHLDHSGFDFVSLPQEQRAKGYYADRGKNYVHEAPINDPKLTYSSGAIYSTVGDLYRWHRVLQDKKLINAKSLEMAYTKYSPTYGYGFQIDSLDDKKTVSHSGGFWGFRTSFTRVPADDICIVLLSNQEALGLSEISRNLLLAIYGKPVQLPVKRVPVTVPQEILQKYVGNYESLSPSFKLEIKLENQGLSMYQFQGPTTELAATDQTHFYAVEQESIAFDFEEYNGQKQLRIKTKGKEIVVVKK